MEQLPRHRDLRHLQSDVPGMRDDLGADLHELLPEAGQRPVRDPKGHYRYHQPPHNIVLADVQEQSHQVTRSHPTMAARLRRAGGIALGIVAVVALTTWLVLWGFRVWYNRGFNEKETHITIKVGDTVTWKKAATPSKDLDPFGIAGCKVVKLGKSENGEPAALIEVFGGGTCGALLADLQKDED